MENHTHFLKLLDFTPAEIQQFLDTAADLKAKKKAGIPHRYLEGKNVALIFEKTSTRTRCSFEVAAQDLGMGSTYLGPPAGESPPIPACPPSRAIRCSSTRPPWRTRGC